MFFFKTKILCNLGQFTYCTIFFYLPVNSPRGHIQPADSLRNTVDVELIADRIRYTLQVCSTAPNAYALLMNGTQKTVTLHRQADGGLLLTVDGATHTTYMREEVDRYRVVIDNRTYVFEKENDPSIVRSPSAGKLLNLLVDEDGHVNRGQPYAEIEVMKMVMQLTAAEAGRLTWCRRAGAVLETGAIIARIQLDDESMVTKATPSSAHFATFAAVEHKKLSSDDGLQHSFDSLQTMLDNQLAGYCLPLEHCEALYRTAIHEYVQMLRSPQLPLLQLLDALASIASRLPATVEADIREQLLLYQNHITSTLVQFPCSAIGGIINAHAATLAVPAERAQFLQLTTTVVQLIQRFRHGLRGHTQLALQRLLGGFLDVEQHFQHGPYERCVAALTTAAGKDDVAAVIAVVFSHTQHAQKRLLVTVLLEHMQAHEPGLTRDLAGVLGELAMLSGGLVVGNTRLAVRARQTLMSAQRPLYAQRRDEMESILLSAVDVFGHEYRPQRLHRLVRLTTAIYDVLPAFFYHGNGHVCLAALEVYVRRAYTLYDIVGVSYVPALSGGGGGAHHAPCVHFEFRLPKTHPRRVSRADGRVIDRSGWMVAFTSFKLFQAGCRTLWTAIAMWKARREATSFDGTSEQAAVDADAAFVLNVALQNNAIVDDEEHARQFGEFCRNNRLMLSELGFRRITFLVLCSQLLPKYFTFGVSDGFAEDRMYRHIEPASAHLLELNRMRNFELEKMKTQNQTMHLYRGEPKLARSGGGGVGTAGPERRYFIRSIVRHPDLSTREASLEYLDREIRQALVDAMDELEMALAHETHGRFRNNHIFLSFIAPVIATLHQIDGSVTRATREWADRLWSLRVLQIELKMRIVRVEGTAAAAAASGAAGDAVQLVRVCVSNNGKHSLNVAVYVEELDRQSQQLQLVSVVTNHDDDDDTRATGPATTAEAARGSPATLPLLQSGNMPYIADNTLQDKRFQAQINQTTYVYDVPDMFAQMTERLWSEFGRERASVESPKSVVVSCAELIWRGGALEEVARFPGANDVSGMEYPNRGDYY